MVDYDLVTCVLCGKVMGATTKPYWIIDPETLEVKGLAHTTCRMKLDYRNMAYYFTTPEEYWVPGGPVGGPPSRGIIAFASKMIRYRLSLPEWETDVDFKVLMLAGHAYKATNLEEFLELPRTKALFDWWSSSKHSDPMADEELEEVKRRLRENLS